MAQKRNIVIIGGGLLQVPLIRTAQAMGLGAVVSDLNAEAPGMDLADYPLVMSTRDIDGSVRVVREFSKHTPVHGVITAGTDASMTVAAIANVLDLPGIKFSDAEAASNKIKMRTRFAEHAIAQPEFRPAWSVSEARAAVEQLKLPVVIKPADNMGARGVIKVNAADEIDRAYKHAKAASPTGSVLVEEFMPGPELSIDALVWDGQVRITGVADRIIEREPFFVEVGHNMPSSMPAVHLDAAQELMTAGIKALGITRGAAKGDVKITPDGPKIGEMAARLSGGFMSSHTFPESTGINLLQAAIEIALGEEPTTLTPRKNFTVIERALIGMPGKLTGVDGVSAAEAIAEVSSVIITKKPGDAIERLTSNIGKVGHVIIRGNSLAEAEATFTKVRELIKINIDESFGLSQKDINEEAKKRFGRAACWVCKVCDGFNCASSVPGMGGLGNMVTFQNNITSLASLRIRPAYIHSHTNPDTSTDFFGYALQSPIWAAPITGVETNMNGAIDEQEYNDIVCQSLFECSSLPFVGDGASAHKYKIGLGALKKIRGKGVAIFKPRADLEALQMRFQLAEEMDVIGIGIDIDAVHFKTLAMKNQPTKSYSLDELKEIRSWTKKPFLLKGIMTPTDALAAAEAGVDGIIISNHGGRVLDNMPGTAEVLPDIVSALRKRYANGGGTPMKIYCDGGVRGGEDAFKMLALGADGVLVGRPFCINAVGGGKAGLKYLHNQYLDGLVRAMRLTGCQTLADITPQHLFYSDSPSNRSGTP